MYSIISCQNSQYKVSAGDKILVNKLPNKVGDEIKLDQVLFIQKEGGAVEIGSPYIKGASFTAKVERQFKAKKVLVFKKRRRANYRRLNGHRQELTELSIKSINF